MAPLGAAEARHARLALRLGPGARVTVFDGQGRTAEGELRETPSRALAVQVDTVQAHPPPRPSVWLGTAVPKGKRWMWLVEKATEAGVDAIWPVRFARGVAKAEGDPAKWRAWALAACKQSRRAWLPDMRLPVDLPDWLREAPGPGTAALWLGDPAGQPVAETAGSIYPAPDRVCVTIGPEGGLTETETQAMDESGWNHVRWGVHTLRTETAAVLGVAAVRINYLLFRQYFQKST